MRLEFLRINKPIPQLRNQPTVLKRLLWSHIWPDRLEHSSSNAQQMTIGFKAHMPDLSSQQAGGKRLLAAKHCLLCSRLQGEENILCLCLRDVLLVRLCIIPAMVFPLDVLLNTLPFFFPLLNNCVLKVHCMPGTAPGSRVTKLKKMPAHSRFSF